MPVYRQRATISALAEIVALQNKMPPIINSPCRINDRRLSKDPRDARIYVREAPSLPLYRDPKTDLERQN